MKKSNINKRNAQFLAAAALTAVLVAGQIQPAMVYGEKTEIQVSSLIPDNVTIENPVPLSDIAQDNVPYSLDGRILGRWIQCSVTENRSL